jgi:plastocyanin
MRGLNLIITVFSLSCLSTDIHAEMVEITLTDPSGNPVVDGVVSAYPQPQIDHVPIESGKSVIIDQIDKEFINHVTPVQVGTTISFPNHDQIRHHVYSFSSAKNFEIPLYKGVPAEPIAFDQAGVVVLGCNIHDQMSAYIVVVDSPYFAKTDEQGYASLSLPMADYELIFWHRDADEDSKNSKQAIKVAVGQTVKINHQLAIKSSWASKPALFSLRNRGRYR